MYTWFDFEFEIGFWDEVVKIFDTEIHNGKWAFTNFTQKQQQNKQLLYNNATLTYISLCCMHEQIQILNLERVLSTLLKVTRGLTPLILMFMLEVMHSHNVNILLKACLGTKRWLAKHYVPLIGHKVKVTRWPTMMSLEGAWFKEYTWKIWTLYLIYIKNYGQVSIGCQTNKKWT